MKDLLNHAIRGRYRLWVMHMGEFRILEAHTLGKDCRSHKDVLLARQITPAVAEKDGWKVVLLETIDSTFFVDDRPASLRKSALEPPAELLSQIYLLS